VLTNPETGAPQCDHCGADVAGPVDLDADEVLCRHHRSWWQGYCEAERESVLEDLRRSILRAVGLLDEADARARIEQLIDEATARKAKLRAVGAPSGDLLGEDYR
jgi:hypothetical protein